MGRRKQDQRRPLDEPLTHNPFRALLGDSAGAAAESTAPEGGQGQGPDPQIETERIPERVEIRVERRGNGGKTVTAIRWLAGQPDEQALASLARTLGRSLGTGVRAKDGVLRAQGDQSRALGAHFDGERGAAVVFGTAQ